MDWLSSVSFFRGNKPFRYVHFDVALDPAHDSDERTRNNVLFDVRDFIEEAKFLRTYIDDQELRRAKIVAQENEDDQESCDKGRIVETYRGRKLLAIWDRVDDGANILEDSYGNNLGAVENVTGNSSLDASTEAPEEDLGAADTPSPASAASCGDGTERSSSHDASATISTEVQDKTEETTAVSSSLDHMVKPIGMKTDDWCHSRKKSVTFSGTTCTVEELHNRLESLPDDLERLEGEIGAVLWRDACQLFTRFLEQYRTSWRGKTVIELGSGCGYVGLALAADDAKVCVTDMGLVVPQLQLSHYMNLRYTDSVARTPQPIAPGARRLQTEDDNDDPQALQSVLSGPDQSSSSQFSANTGDNIRVAKCDWLEEKVPSGEFEYVICCEVLYAGRDVWPGLKKCLQKIVSQSGPAFKEVLLAINLRVGRTDIDQFLNMLREDDNIAGAGERDCQGAVEFEISKLWDNYSGISAEEQQQQLQQHRMNLERERRHDCPSKDEDTIILTDDEKNEASSSKRSSKAASRGKKRPEKKAAQKKDTKKKTEELVPDQGEQASMTDFGIEIYSFRRRHCC